MRIVSIFPILWRLMLAVSLAMAPLVPVAAAGQGGDQASGASAMPCHAASAESAADGCPCDGDCCERSDCGPGSCRLIGSLIVGSASRLPGQLPQLPIAAFSSPAVPGALSGEPLRPPIA